MKWNLLSGFVLLGLVACTAPVTTYKPSYSVSNTSESVVERLNARYDSTVASCADGTPAYECSGILLRRVTYNPNYDFWGHSADAIRLGSSTFSYIRSGVNSRSADITSGYILMDPQTAADAGKMKLELRCIYPFMADTQNTNRTLNGCSLANEANPPTPPNPADVSRCALLNPPVTTASQWLENFERHGSNRVNQCSLSTVVPEQFLASLQVRPMLPELTAMYGNEVLVALWDTSTPEQLPIEAIFYAATKPAELANAQALKHSYQVRTGIELPIVRLDFSKPSGQRFALRATDQEDGWSVASRLNARYNDTSSRCPDGKSALYCNGVILRTTSYSADYHAWNPSSNAVLLGAVSFSYLRADSGITLLAWDWTTKGRGIIFRELNYHPESDSETLIPLCIYPTDGATAVREQSGCGAMPKYADTSPPCAQQGITTFARYQQYYRALSTDERGWRQCSLAIEPDFVQWSVGDRKQYMAADWEVPHHNELMIAAWPADIPERLPIDAFFYLHDMPVNLGIEHAQGMQADLMRSADGLFKPVIRLNLTPAANEQVFTFRYQDQSK